VNREAGLSGIRNSILAIIGMALMPGVGALSSYWLIGTGVTARAAQPVPNRDTGESDIQVEADPTSVPFVSDPVAMEDFACEEAQADRMLQDLTPDPDDDSEDWLNTIAAMMGLTEEWTDYAAGAWSSCQM
jgi:hypothetical protein